MPPWIRLAIVLEIAGAACAGVLLVRTATQGAQAVDDGLHWVAPRIATVGPPPTVVPALPRPGATPAASTREQLDRLGLLGGPLLGRLDADAATTAAGELRLVTALEGVIRERVTRALDVATGRR